MSEVKNYYEILGLDKDASEKDIKKAYRKLAAKWHPDRFATASDKEKKEAEEKFKEINEANSILSDPEKRSNYDQFGDPNGNPMMGGGFDPFEGFDPFGRFGGGMRQRVEKGEDDKIVVNLTLEEAFSGCEKEITFKRKVRCSHCNGTGSDDGKTHECPYCHGTGRIRQQTQRGNMMMINETTCPHCHGTGRDSSSNVKKCNKCGGTGFEYQTIKEKITIPAGVDSGMHMTKEGYAHEPLSNGINGDLYIVFNIIEKNGIERQGNDLMLEIPVNLYEAWCGAEKTIECIDGSKISVKIPELSEDGKILRVPGKGMTSLHSSIRGSLYLKVKYITPKKITNDQKELLKKFYNI